MIKQIICRNKFGIREMESYKDTSGFIENPSTSGCIVDTMKDSFAVCRRIHVWWHEVLEACLHTWQSQTLHFREDMGTLLISHKP